MNFILNSIFSSSSCWFQFLNMVSEHLSTAAASILQPRILIVIFLIHDFCNDSPKKENFPENMTYKKEANGEYPKENGEVNIWNAVQIAEIHSSEIPSSPLTVDNSLPIPDMKPCIVRLCKDLFKQWSNLGESDFSLKIVSGGHTEELQAIPYFSAARFDAKLLGVFGNGMVQSFINARTFTPSDMRNLKLAAEIAKQLRRFHRIKIPGSKEPQLWNEEIFQWLLFHLAMFFLFKHFQFLLLLINVDDVYLQQMLGFRAMDALSFRLNYVAVFPL